MSEQPEGRAERDEPPPMLGTWPRVYAAVLLNLVLMVLGFWLFSRVFA